MKFTRGHNTSRLATEKATRLYSTAGCSRGCGAILNRKQVSFPDGQTATISVCPTCKMEIWNSEDRQRWSKYNNEYDEKNPPEYEKWKTDRKMRAKPCPGHILVCANPNCKKTFELANSQYAKRRDKNLITCSHPCRIVVYYLHKGE
jgi:hypothetical protein